MATPWLFLCLIVVTGFTGVAHAHEIRTIYIELNETAPQHYQLQWKTPPSVALFNVPNVALPKTCRPQSALSEFNSYDGVVRQVSYRCPHSLAGEPLTISYPAPNPSVSSVLRLMLMTGERHMVVLAPHQNIWIIPQAESKSVVTRQYTLLGVKHVLGGIDHLLFIAGLLWIAGTWRRIVVTITGFTLAHSTTLILTVLQLVRLPMPPVEAVIALSIVFVATEIVKGQRDSLTWRYPIAVSSSFGLLHGCGFAAALTGVGLPQTELATALLFFNVGVEIGQVLFAASIFGFVHCVRRLGAKCFADEHRMKSFRTGIGYIIGASGGFWLICRSAAFL